MALGPAWQESGNVFVTAIGTPIDASNLRRAWRSIAKAAGLPGVRFHDLRHFHATLLLLNGVPIRTVSERLGHARPDITLNVYSHTLPHSQDEAVAVLDRLFRKK